MMRVFILVCLCLFGLAPVLSACGQAAKYPNQVAVKIEREGGGGILQGWQPAPKTNEKFSSQYVPENPVFDGAMTYFVNVPQKNPKKAAVNAVKQAGMTSAKVISMTTVDKQFTEAVDPAPDADYSVVMLEGKIKGKPARAIGFILYGNLGEPEGTPPSSGVHMFQAPTPVFEALGGMAIPGVLWLGGVCAEDENMLEDGRLSPKEATEKLTVFVNSWIINYVQNQMMLTMMMGQTMAIQQQTIQNMQSYNNALSQCGGAGDCMSMNGDGSWSADVQ